MAQDKQEGNLQNVNRAGLKGLEKLSKHPFIGAISGMPFYDELTLHDIVTRFFKNCATEGVDEYSGLYKDYDMLDQTSRDKLDAITLETFGHYFVDIPAPVLLFDTKAFFEIVFRILVFREKDNCMLCGGRKPNHFYWDEEKKRYFSIDS